jgi:hypothetical protein
LIAFYHLFVIPAKAGIHISSNIFNWIPVFTCLPQAGGNDVTLIIKYSVCQKRITPNEESLVWGDSFTPVEVF